MFTVALIGPDGAGKSTISRRVADSLPLPAKTIYMGINLDATELVLPTTRLVRAIRRSRAVDAGTSTSSTRGPARTLPAFRALASIRSAARLVNWICEEWYRQAVASYHTHRGTVVIFDRHFFPDFYVSDVVETDGGRALSRRIHGWLLATVYPKPDLVIYLDVPAEELLRRKGEGTIESLERRRQEYLEMRSLFQRFVIVDAAQSLADVERLIAQKICDFYEERTAPSL